MLPSSQAWGKLRTLRSSQPLPDGDSKRRATFLSALVQFEELMDAAAAVGPASRLLLLFYALSQAGRAVVASRQVRDWQCQGHGLKFPYEAVGLLDRRVRVTKDPLSSFHQVSAATGSPVVEGASCSMAELCASLPELANLPALTAGWTVPDPPVFKPTPDATGWGHGVRLRWQVASEHSSNEHDRRVRLFEVATAYLKQGRYWIRPAIGDQPSLVSPLMTWWQLLYGLSMVARYEPDVWVSALDLNSSVLAVPLEELLDDALISVPHLVLNELLTAPYLTPETSY